MASSPDPLFRNGLEHYRKAAPASVWDRVEAGLDRKRRKTVWLKVAAGLCLLMATSVVLWQSRLADTSVTEVAVGSQQSTLSSPQSAVVDREASDVSREKMVTHDLTTSQKASIVERTSAQRSRSRRNEPRKSSKQSSVSSEQLAVTSRQSGSTTDEIQIISIVEPEEIITETTKTNEFEGAVDVTAIENKRTNITYTAEQVNTRFTKKELPTQATPEKKNASGFQKVIDKALEITNEGAVYGDLREKKNEWLSFNNLSNKTEPNK